jgi:hypothetical protein
MNDLNTVKSLNFIANSIDDEYNNVQFAVNHSYENNSITYKSAPANFQTAQQGLITRENLDYRTVFANLRDLRRLKLKCVEK